MRWAKCLLCSGDLKKGSTAGASGASGEVGKVGRCRDGAIRGLSGARFRREMGSTPGTFCVFRVCLLAGQWVNKSVQLVTVQFVNTEMRQKI